ncbi:hypothetical protein HQP42_15290 [Rhodococcus fascians]|nr:hypothetical protein [Rhodococcus fascians]MBY3826508.1 hypothetical protein [Rhodococcus fascians]MBY3836969.1 hypothetical protein [Rhodococcus fascians]MBY3865564.1 hypothetical protein [Rhodococcus fascians]MBY3885651.1 hypothetical protein [Rhodococcus fascians]
MLDSTSRKTGAIVRSKVSSTSSDTRLSASRVAEYRELARQWKPFGGVPEEEIFVRFGVTKATFDDEVSAQGRSSLG